MGDTVEEQESSRAAATPADSTIAGETRRTVIEPRTLEIDSAVEPDSRAADMT